MRNYVQIFFSRVDWSTVPPGFSGVAYDAGGSFEDVSEKMAETAQAILDGGGTQIDNQTVLGTKYVRLDKENLAQMFDFMPWPLWDGDDFQTQTGTELPDGWEAWTSFDSPRDGWVDADGNERAAPPTDAGSGKKGAGGRTRSQTATFEQELALIYQDLILKATTVTQGNKRLKAEAQAVLQILRRLQRKLITLEEAEVEFAAVLAQYDNII